MNLPLDLLESAGEFLLPRAGSMLLQSSALILVLLLVEVTLRRRLRPALRHSLWLLVPLKLLLPPSLSLPTSPVHWIPARWFWFANHRLRAAREESVDDTVAFELGDRADDYPASLVEVARAALTRPVLSLGPVGILESRNTLRHRIERLLESPPTRRPRLSFAGGFVVSVVALVLIPMAGARNSGATEPQPVRAALDVDSKKMPAAGKPNDGASQRRQLEVKLADEEKALADLLTRYKEGWPAVIERRRAIAHLRAWIAPLKVEEARERYKNADEAMRDYSQAIEDSAKSPTPPGNGAPRRDLALERLLGEEHDRAKKQYAELSRQADAGNQLSILIESHFLTVADSALAALGLPPGAVTGGQTNPILDAARLTDLLKIARTHKDVRLLGNPRILTLSHRAAEVTTSAPGSATNQPTSISFTVIPELLPDGRQLRLTMTARITETFDLAKLPAADQPPRPNPSNGTTIGPNAIGYLTRSMTNSAVVTPGQVVVMGYRADPGTLPAEAREGFVFVKATLVEPAGKAQVPENPPRPR